MSFSCTPTFNGSTDVATEQLMSTTAAIFVTGVPDSSTLIGPDDRYTDDGKPWTPWPDDRYTAYGRPTVPWPDDRYTADGKPWTPWHDDRYTAYGRPTVPWAGSDESSRASDLTPSLSSEAELRCASCNCSFHDNGELVCECSRGAAEPTACEKPAWSCEAIPKPCGT